MRQRKKVFKRWLTFALTLAMVFTSANIPAVTASAAAKKVFVLNHHDGVCEDALGSSGVTVSYEDEGKRAVVKGPEGANDWGTDVWGVQIMTCVDVSDLTKLKMYKVSFDVTSNVDRTIFFKIQGHGQNENIFLQSNDRWEDGGFAVQANQKYTYSGTTSKAIDVDELQVIFALGKYQGAQCTVTIENLSFEEVAVSESGSSDAKLLWSDEFDGNYTNKDAQTGLNLDDWEYQLGDGTGYCSNKGWGNAELQAYTKDKKNIEVKDGKLRITAVKEDSPYTYPDYVGQDDAKNYTSARIRTKSQSAMPTYGYIEGYMSLPKVTGSWPAFWMLPNSETYGHWPYSGEIDIMEARGTKGVGGTLHWGQTPNGWQSTYLTSGDKQIDYEAFHKYGIEWTSDKITWYYDGAAIFTVTAAQWADAVKLDGGALDGAAPFDQSFYLLLNLAVDSGQFQSGPPENDGAAFRDNAISMYIDYIRVYDRKPLESQSQPTPGGDGDSSGSDTSGRGDKGAEIDKDGNLILYVKDASYGAITAFYKICNSEEEANEQKSISEPTAMPGYPMDKKDNGYWEYNAGAAASDKWLVYAFNGGIQEQVERIAISKVPKAGEESQNPGPSNPTDAAVPTVTVSQTSSVVKRNEKVTLTASASVTDQGTLSYQWYRNTQQSYSGATEIGGANGAAYEVPTDSAGTAYYYVKVTNTNNEASGSKTASAQSNILSVTVEEDAAPEPGEDNTETTPEPGENNTETTPGPGEDNTETVPGPGEDNTETAPEPGEDNTETVPGPGEDNTETTPGPGEDNTETVPGPGEDNTETTPGPGEDNTETTPPDSETTDPGNDTPDITNAAKPTVKVTQSAASVPYKGKVMLQAAAEVADGGTLSYQWYKNTSATTVGAEAIEGATGAVYDVPTNTTGDRYYFVVVANANNAVNGEKFAVTASEILKVTVTKLPNPLRSIETTIETVKGAGAIHLKTGEIGAATFTSSKPKVATVNQAGKITIKGTGRAVITVAASGDAVYDSYTAEITVIVAPKKAVLSSVKSKKSRTVTVKWKKDTGATGYEVQYSSKKNFKGATTVRIKKARTVKTTIKKKLKGGKQYYIRVRAYKNDVGTITGEWSKSKRIKVKR